MAKSYNNLQMIRLYVQKSNHIIEDLYEWLYISTVITNLLNHFKIFLSSFY